MTNDFNVLNTPSQQNQIEQNHCFALFIGNVTINNNTIVIIFIQQNRCLQYSTVSMLELEFVLCSIRKS